MKRLRHMVIIGPSPKEIKDVSADDEVTFAPMEAIADGIGGLDISISKPLKDVRSGSFNYFAVGDLLLAKVTPCFENGKKAVASSLTNGVGFATSEVHVIRPDTSQVNRQYLHYLLCSEDFRAEGMRSMSGAGGLKRISDLSILDYRPAITDVKSQELVASRLDRETARIDALIEKKTRFIDLLKEKRQALITQAVTKGLDPTVPMKDSGVEWIGEVPAHWDVKRLKFLGRAFIGLTYSPDDVTDDETGTPVLRSANIQDGKLDLTDLVRVRRPIPAKLMVNSGDILVCSRNGSRELIGKNVQLGEESTHSSFGAFMTVIRSEIADFLYWIFNSYFFEAQSGLFMTSTVNQLTTSMLNNMSIPLPPRKEGDAIADYLSVQMKKSNRLLDMTEQSIQLLKERRSALITAAVTGQIDLREDAA